MTKIEWCDETWNPITGCSPISEGCTNCFAKRMANRLRGRYGYPEDEPFRVTFHPNRLGIPIKWKKPKRIFTCSMGDLFHLEVEFGWIEEIFDVMRQNQDHIFILLTKRPNRVLRYWEWRQNEYLNMSINSVWPDHVWIGSTAENQRTADDRIPILLQIPAAVRFVSVEPMLGPVNLKNLFDWHCPQCNSLNPQIIWPCPDCKGDRYKAIDWVICGAETGPGARPMQPEWATDLYEQCKEASVPFFFKKSSKGLPVPDAIAQTREFPNGKR